MLTTRVLLYHTAAAEHLSRILPYRNLRMAHRTVITAQCDSSLPHHLCSDPAIPPEAKPTPPVRRNRHRPLSAWAAV